MALKLETHFYFSYKMAMHFIIFNNRLFCKTLKYSALQNRVFANLLLFYYNFNLFFRFFIIIFHHLWDIEIYFRYKKRIVKLREEEGLAKPISFGIPDAYLYNCVHRGTGVLPSGYVLLHNRGHT